MKRQSYLIWVILALIVILIAAGCSPSRRPTNMTTVLLLRHAERDNGSLNEDGLERANELAHVVRKAGVTAIYTTDTERTRQTVQPLADLLNLDPLIYQVGSPDQIEEFAARVRRDQRGKTALVVSHNPTVPLIIDTLGGDPASCSIGDAYDEFDDLCVVTIYDAEAVQVLDLQYGRPSP
jgi:broad specificity phosphatase PhoE